MTKQTWVQMTAAWTRKDLLRLLRRWGFRQGRPALDDDALREMLWTLRCRAERDRDAEEMRP